MRTAIFLLLLIPSCASATTVPLSTRATFDNPSQLLRLTLVNMSGQRRQVHLSSGTVNLPIGQPVVIEAKIGTRLIIVSDRNTSIQEQVTVTSHDDSRIISVM